MKFSIRDLLLVTLIVALAAGWLVEHRELHTLRDEHRMLEMSHDLLASTIEEVMDQHGKQGGVLLMPIYDDQAPRIRTLTGLQD